jgi:orotate phosphoribosyltransferase
MLNDIAEHLSKLIPNNIEIQAGLEMGGIPTAIALSLKTGIPVVFVRKNARESGTCKLAEGMDIKGKNVCIIEDVVTTGGQILLSFNDLKTYGANVNNVISVIEREQSGRDNLENAGLQFISLFKMDELLAGNSTLS